MTLFCFFCNPRFSLVLELWQFSFMRDWPEIRKSEIPTSEFFPISGDWSELWIPNLTRMSLIECYWMVQNSRVTAFTVFALLRENQLGDKITPPPHAPTQISVKRNQIRLTREIKLTKLDCITNFLTDISSNFSGFSQSPVS